METGEIVRWDDVKGFGFIQPEGGGVDVFLHRSKLPLGVTVATGDRVEFTTATRDRGPYADNVQMR